ncbi:MAG: hypothetical protein LBE91_06900 [Tannerella sp.]|nr:hypothetical protein [Tannerella sp.]
MPRKDYFEIVIAGITIRFQTAHQSDTDCLERLFPYHKDTNVMPYEKGGTVHDIIFSNGHFDLPEDIVPVWKGFINTEYHIGTVWYNSKAANESFIAVGRDILIHHIPGENLSACYLAEKKNLFGKSHRPKLNIYVFLLIHSILSMYGKYSLHSSCVAKNGLAYLFLGKSGNGKTTVSTLLGKAGFDYMGDDITFISRDETGELCMDSFLYAAKIVNENAKTNRVVKDIVDVIKIHQFTPLYHQKLGAIFLLRRDFSNKTSALQPVSQGSVYTRLIQSGNHIQMQYNPQLWLDICGQATTLPCYNLIFGNKDYFDPGIFNDVINK